MATPHWAIPTMAGSDAANTIDDTFDAAMAAIDDMGKVIFDVFANRGTAATRKSGSFFQPTDVPGFLYLSDGTNWIEIAPGMGSVPIGGWVGYFGTTDPGDTRFVLADGRALSQATYPVLYAMFSNNFDTMFGQSAPSAGQFRIPKMNGRMPVGAGASSGLTTRAVGSGTTGSGGEEAHTLSTSEMPTHSHPPTDANNFLSMLGSTGGGSLFQGALYSGGDSYRMASGGLFGATASTGSGTSHNNMPPFVTTNFLIRIA
jgi:microcystin-dependent protein